jgi:VTC domain-containing protein
MRLRSLQPWSDPADTWQASPPRHEVKFIGASREAPFVAASLEALCAPDGAFPENVVHSVYFDSPDLASYAEKTAGDYLKTKVRLRWYAEAERAKPKAGADWTAWLEVKTRTGSLGAKRRKLVRLSGPSPLEGLDPEMLGAVVQEHLGSSRRPTCWVSYSRTRLWGPDGLTRLSIDRDLRVDWVARWIPTHWLGATPPIFVVEVKGDTAAVHPALSTLLVRHARKHALSKYALCLDYARGGTV